ncbi:YbjQ family protein [Desulfovibrio sp. OttesenSCG-928-C06]|nr:YbjQ family protein [Desulfovibrio sp. OttesenSCG-928-C06]
MADNCTLCGKKLGGIMGETPASGMLVSECAKHGVDAKVMCTRCAEGEIERVTNDAAAIAASKDPKNSVIISTSDLKKEYKILDTVFAIDAHQEGFFAGAADPAKAFNGVKEQLKTKCVNLGGNAVISCQFEYRVATGEGLFGGAKQVMEIFAYGTVVKFI